MKLVFTAFLLALLFGGCSGVDPEDKAFFYSGWINPNKRAPAPVHSAPSLPSNYKRDPLIDG